MRGSEFLRKVKRLGRKQGDAVTFVPGHGKGSHGALYFGNYRTTLKDLKKEIPSGLLQGMCKDLGFTPQDLF